MSRTPRRELILVCVLVAVVALYARWTYIPSFADRHIAASEVKYDFDVGAPGPWFSAWSLGDGQAYVLIALDPTGQKLAEEISEAGYRYARAGYGWLGWAASLGRDELVPHALALVGLISVIGLVVLANSLRPRLGPRSWLLVLNPAVFIGFAGDTSEPLGVFLLGLALATGSTISALALGMTRPTYAVALWGRWKLFVAAATGTAVLAAYGFTVFGFEAMIPSGGRIGLPFVAYFTHPSLWGLVVACLGLATLVAGFRGRDWSWVVCGVFVICLGDDVLAHAVNAWRAVGFVPVLWAFGVGYRIPARVPSVASVPA